MKVRSNRNVVNGSYVVTIRTEDFLPEESRWISQMGEPDVSTGGVISDGAGATFTFPTTVSGVVSGFSGPGLSKSFNSVQMGNPEAIALAWEAEVTERILAAMVALKNSADLDFSGENVSQPSYS